MCTESTTWSHVFQCVSTELFPKLSINLRECFDEMLVINADFKSNDFSRDAVKQVLERLKQKRPTNDTEIDYLKRLISRVAEEQQSSQRLVYIH